jgi:hypothetical protein
MKAPPFTALGLCTAIACTALTCTGARAETATDAEALRSSLTEMLSLLSFGSVSVADGPAELTQSGNDVRIRLPLNGFVAPAGASVEAVAHSAADGAWDLTSMTFPAAGALGTSIDHVVSYTVARQAIHGRLDPKLTMPSTLVADLGAITLQTASGSQTSEQAIERITLDGTISGEAGGRADLLVRDAAYNWHLMARDPGVRESDSLVRHLDGHVSLAGLDRAQGRRFMAAAHSFTGTANASPRQADLSPSARAGLREMLDATDGLLTRIEADETLDGTKLSFSSGNSATLARAQLHVSGSSADQLLNVGMDVGLDELSLPTLSADSAAFLPRHVAAKSILAGIPANSLRALLRAALAPDADHAVLQSQATALLKAPGARAEIESVAFDAGPLQVRSSTRFVPRDNGEIGANIHISATGVDALVARVQATPSMQGVLPMVFLAKGMGRVQGDSIVWDIALGGGPLTVNGMPFGQPAGRTR